MDKVTVSFDIEFLNGSKADDTYFLVVWYPDKSYDKLAEPGRRPAPVTARMPAELIPRGATKGRITRVLAQPTGDVYSLRVQRRENLPGGRDGWPTVSNFLDMPAP